MITDERIEELERRLREWCSYDYVEDVGELLEEVKKLKDYAEMLEKMKEQLVNNYGCLLKENEQLKLFVETMGIRHRYEKNMDKA